MKETSFPLNAYTTAEQAINNEDLSNKTALVTGCNAGIGKETVRVLVKQGCNVIMACRNGEKAYKARSDILKDVGLAEDTKQLTFMQLDLSSLESIKQFSDEIVSQKICIDYLINNAGVASFPKYTTSKDGFEMVCCVVCFVLLSFFFLCKDKSVFFFHHFCFLFIFVFVVSIINIK